MKKLWERLAWVSVYALAMAFLESAVVVYLRGLLNVTNETVQFGSYYTIEVWREAATLLMLIALGWLAGRKLGERIAYLSFAFGLWDIGYYLWLKVLINWPESFFSPDVLFLIPLRWMGPVLSPMLIAALMCAASVLALVGYERGRGPKFSWKGLLTLLAGGLLALYVFMSESLASALAGRPDWNNLYPGPFNWPVFILAFLLMTVPLLHMLDVVKLRWSA